MLNSDQRTTLRVLSIGAAVVWVIIGLSMSWPLWLWIGLAVVSLVAPPLATMVLTERALRSGTQRPSFQEEEEEVITPSPPPPPPQPQGFGVKDVLLQSVREDYQFVFACTVRWLPQQDQPVRHANPGALAADTILDEAARLTATLHPRDTSRAEYLLMSALGAPRVDRSGLVQVWANEISIQLSPEDKKRLDQLAEIRKDEDAWEGKCSYERKVRDYLGEDVLTTPGSALVWWLAGPRTDEKSRVGDAVKQIDNLRQLTRVATNSNADDEGDTESLMHPDFQYTMALDTGPPRSVTPNHPWVVAEAPVENTGHPPNEADVPLNERARKLVEKFPDGAERALFARQFGDLLESQGYPETADEIRCTFDAPSTNSSPTTETPEPGADSAVTPAEQPADGQEQSTSGQHPGHNTSMEERFVEGDSVGVETADTETVSTTTKNSISQQQTHRLDDMNGLGGSHPDGAAESPSPGQ